MLHLDAAAQAQEKLSNGSWDSFFILDKVTNKSKHGCCPDVRFMINSQNCTIWIFDDEPEEGGSSAFNLIFHFSFYSSILYLFFISLCLCPWPFFLILFALSGFIFNFLCNIDKKSALE